jgi:hypothetical protein
MLKTVMFLFSLILVMMPVAQAGTKCEPVSGGGICCWDVDKEGIFKPISCA